MTFEECKLALGKQTGVAFRVIGKREVPQELYEFGFIEHDRSPIFSYTQPRDVATYTKVIFDRGELKGKSFEFAHYHTNSIPTNTVDVVRI